MDAISGQFLTPSRLERYFSKSLLAVSLSGIFISTPKFLRHLLQLYCRFIQIKKVFSRPENLFRRYKLCICNSRQFLRKQPQAAIQQLFSKYGGLSMLEDCINKLQKIDLHCNNVSEMTPAMHEEFEKTLIELLQHSVYENRKAVSIIRKLRHELKLTRSGLKTLMSQLQH
jgi:hypothetical protein